jgi:ABC-2 type transport system permease protein
VNWQHFRAFLWLRWRIRVNQLRRGGTANLVAAAVMAAAGALLAAGGFVGLLLVGLYALPQAPPPVLMYVWDGLVVAFLFFWLVGLLTELQRSEALSLDKFLHLPVSLTGVFLINYLTALVCPCMVLFLPAMVGLCLGLALGRGPAMLALLPLLAAFLLAVTALTYQFQGWLAALMVNKRRRRTVMVVATAAIILLSQVPNLLNVVRPWDDGQPGGPATRQAEQLAELQRAASRGAIDAAEYQRRLEELRRASEARNEEYVQHLDRTARFVNLVLPPGWLPLGARDLAEGIPLPAVVGTLGLGLIGAASLWRSYRTTVRLYTGQFTAKKRRPADVTAPPVTVGAVPRTLLVERQLPGLSEQAAAIAVSGVRALIRAPEAKMMLLTPVLMLVIFGSMFLSRRSTPPEAVRPLIATGAMAMILLSMGQLIGNQFGFDRGGFRVFVLCAARRGDILLGKNLAFAPLALGLGAAAVIVLQAVHPMRFDHFLATAPQFVSMYLLFCLLANLLSILAPMPIAAGSMRPANAKLIPVLLHLAFSLVSPAVLALTLVPLGVEALLAPFGWAEHVPINLLLSLAECAAVVVFYRLALTWEGDLLQAREQRILETVATKAE